MSFWDCLHFSLLLCGHFALWVMVINRLHATGLPRLLIKALDKLIYLAVLGVPIAIVCLILTAPQSESLTVGQALAGSYYFVCLSTAFVAAGTWFDRRRLWKLDNASLISNHTAVHNAANDLGYRPVFGWPTRLAAALPGNQIFELNVNVKTLRLPTLPAALDGLSITHLSDIHMTGRLTQPFFDYVVDRANELDSDLVCITGDIVEKAHCVPWIKPTLGRLASRHGKFFVLGNHDKRLRDVAAARRALVEVDLVDLGGRWLWHNVRGERLLLAGNEVPWFGPAPNMTQAEMSKGGQPPFRLLLSHSPDQIAWARRHGFDLMLAGHNHGGQICLPLLGPLVAPSYFGVKYASGLFQEGPTLMHVSRGISGLEPLRFNCPPELTKLVLVRE